MKDFGNIVLDSEKREGIYFRKNYTQVPNFVFDELLGQIVERCGTPTAGVVWLILYRWSYGFHRNWCRLSAKGIARLIKISERCVKTVLKQLKENNFIRAIEGRRGTTPTYIIGRPSGAKSAPVQRDQAVQIVPPQACRDSTSTSEEFAPHRNKGNRLEKLPQTPSQVRGRLIVREGKCPREPQWWDPWEEVCRQLYEKHPEAEMKYPGLLDATPMRGANGHTVVLRKGSVPSKTLEHEELLEWLAEELNPRGVNVLEIAA